MWRSWSEGYPDPDDDAAIQASRNKIESYGLQVFSVQASVRGINPISEDSTEPSHSVDLDWALTRGISQMVGPSGLEPLTSTVSR